MGVRLGRRLGLPVQGAVPHTQSSHAFPQTPHHAELLVWRPQRAACVRGAGGDAGGPASGRGPTGEPLPATSSAAVSGQHLGVLEPILAFREFLALSEVIGSSPHSPTAHLLFLCTCPRLMCPSAGALGTLVLRGLEQGRETSCPRALSAQLCLKKRAGGASAGPWVAELGTLEKALRPSPLRALRAQPFLGQDAGSPEGPGGWGPRWPWPCHPSGPCPQEEEEEDHEAPCSLSLEEGSFWQASTTALHTAKAEAAEAGSWPTLLQHSVAARSAALPRSRGSSSRKRTVWTWCLLSSFVIRAKANYKDSRDRSLPSPAAERF